MKRGRVDISNEEEAVVASTAVFATPELVHLILHKVNGPSDLLTGPRDLLSPMTTMTKLWLRQVCRLFYHTLTGLIKQCSSLPLNKIPDVMLRSLHGLRYLRMSTKFQGTTLQSLDSLSSLLLSYNARSEGPCDIGRMTQLTSLSLMGNHEKCPHLSQLRRLDQLTGLTRLCLYDNTVVTGEAFDCLTGLTELTLEGNHSESVETSLTCLANLKSLLLVQNERTSHETLSRLTALTSLSLEGNWMVTDAALVTLTNLRTLNLRDNARITLEALRNLPRLTELRVSRKSTVVPEHFYRDAERTRDYCTCNELTSNFFRDNIPSLVKFNIEDRYFGY